MAESTSESRRTSELASTHDALSDASGKISYRFPSMHQQGVMLRRVDSPSLAAGIGLHSRPTSDHMNINGKSPPPMSYVQLTNQRAQIVYDMTCEDEEREKFEVKLKELRQQLDMLLQTEQNDLSLDIKLQMSDIYLTMQTQLGSSEECRQRKEFRENQLRYIDQMLSEGNLQGDHDGGTDEVKDYTTDGSRERPVKVHRSNTFAESSGRRMYPTNSSGVPGKILWRRPSPNQNGIHIRQRSNPEQGRLAHELMMRSRVDPASSVGDLPANFPALGARRSSRSPRQSNEHLDTSATSINSFNLQGRASTNASLQSLDMSYPHHSISADDSYLSSSAHRELSRFDDSSHPSMVVSSIGSLSSHHSRSSSADYNDLRGELRGTQFGDQRMGAVSKPHHSLSTRLTSLAADGSLASKVDMIQSLLTMLRPSDQDEMSRTLLAMANSKESCVAMRQSGCIPLLLQILHPRGEDGVTVRSSREAKMRATATLHNIIHLQGHSHESVREMNVLRLLEQVRTLTDVRRLQVEKATNRRDIPLTSANMKLMAEQQRPGHGIESLMQLSYKQEYRPAILLLGGVYAVGELLEADHKAIATSVMSRDDSDINRLHPGTDLRRHCCVILTNLTFGGAAVKIELCRMINCLHIIVLQLESHSEELVKAAGNILRNLSWNAEEFAKKSLHSCNTVGGIIRACRRAREETTLRALTSALWNLSAFKENKADICAESGGLKLILHLLKHWTSAKYAEDIVQNAAGILLNISSYVSSREAYRQRLRESGLYQVLVELLKSGSPEMLEKVCGILWNLSSRSAADQSKLWDLGAVPALHRLTKSVQDPKIQKAAAQALKNLMQAKGGAPHGGLGVVVEATGSRQWRPKREPGVGMDASLLQGNQLAVPSASGHTSGLDGSLLNASSLQRSSNPPPKPRRMLANQSFDANDIRSHAVHVLGSHTPPLSRDSQPNSRSHSRSQSKERQPPSSQLPVETHGSGLSSESDRLSSASSSSAGSFGRERRRQARGRDATNSPTLETQL